MAPVWLFLLQIHVWLSKLIHGPSVALGSLVCPLSHTSRTVSQEARGSPQDTGQMDYLWCPLRRVRRKPTAPQGYRDSVPLLPVLSPSYVDEGNWFIFPSASPKRSLLVHTQCALGNQLCHHSLKSWGFQNPLPQLTRKHKKPHGGLFWLPTSDRPGEVCLLTSKQPFTFILEQIYSTTPIYPTLL